jgi:hypothetical protein
MAGTFTFVFNDAYGASDLSAVTAVFQTQQAQCYITAVLWNASLSLNGVSAGMTIGSPGTLQNSACAVNVGAASGVSSGNTYTLTLPLTFTSALAGPNSVSGSAISTEELYGYQTLGAWTVGPACVPNPNGMTISDVQNMVNAALGAIAASGDTNNDGVVNVVDLQIAIDAVLAANCE